MRCVSMVVLACLSSLPLHAKDGVDCWAGTKKAIQKDLSGLVLRLSPLPEAVNITTGNGCRAQLFNSQRKLIFSAADWGFSIVLNGQDVNGDGSPDLVLEGYSGGAHCCWTYYIVSLGDQPGLLTKFENERGAGFVVNKNTGRMEIHALDGTFDYFDEFAHASSPFPDVYLRLEGRKLLDISQEHLVDYDKSITKLKAEISAKDLAVFLQAENRDEKIGWENVSANVVKIVQAYLYSGRKAQAHATLRKMWPPFDQQRMWELILQTRRKGILRYTRTKV
jgi:hypothetical protein